jgi:hypothetical protein
LARIEFDFAVHIAVLYRARLGPTLNAER